MPCSRAMSAVTLLGTLVGIGCSAPVVDDVADASGASTEGIVLVERVAATDGTQTNVSAKFMRLGAPADPDLAERVVGSRLEVPALGTCKAIRPSGREAGVASLANLGSIELLDVGDLTIRTGRTAMPLAARAFPDVGERVSGVFYTSRDAASDLPAAARYSLEGTGSAQVDRFVIEADAPSSPEDVRVGENALGDGIALDDGMTTRVQWRAEGRERSDVILIDLGGANGASVRCAFDDTGEGTVPGSFISARSLGSQVAVAVHRIRELPFAAAGVDVGVLRFDLALVGRATLGPRSSL